MDFTFMDINTITSGFTSDGVRYLELFMQAFFKEFGEKVNPGCNKCIATYLDRYKKRFQMNNDKTQFRLQAKYENIPLEFGSPILVNNSNITDEYAKKLLLHENGERYFSQMPEKGEKKLEIKQEDTPAITMDLLQANLKKAEDELSALPEKAHHATKGKLVKAVAAAKEAIVNFKPLEAAGDFKDIDTIQLEIKQEDIDRVPALLDAGYNVGDTVLVDINDYNVVGEITITNIVEDLENDSIQE